VRVRAEYRADELFRERVDEAREALAEWWVEELVSLADEGKNKMAVETRKWLAQLLLRGFAIASIPACGQRARCSIRQTFNTAKVFAVCALYVKPVAMFRGDRARVDAAV
jgi:hypothetical protein